MKKEEKEIFKLYKLINEARLRLPQPHPPQPPIPTPNIRPNAKLAPHQMAFFNNMNRVLSIDLSKAGASGVRIKASVMSYLNELSGLLTNTGLSKETINYATTTSTAIADSIYNLMTLRPGTRVFKREIDNIVELLDDLSNWQVSGPTSQISPFITAMKNDVSRLKAGFLNLKSLKEVKDPMTLSEFLTIHRQIPFIVRGLWMVPLGLMLFIVLAGMVGVLSKPAFMVAGNLVQTTLKNADTYLFFGFFTWVIEQWQKLKGEQLGTSGNQNTSPQPSTTTDTTSPVAPTDSSTDGVQATSKPSLGD